MDRTNKTKAEVLKEIQEYRKLDIPWGRVLNSICSWPLDIGVEAFLLGIDTNLGDPRIFKGTQAVEKKVIELLGDLLGNKNCTGNILSGGTEANLLALYAAKCLKPNIEKPEIIVSTAVHFSIQKAIAILGLTACLADVDEKFKLKPESVKKMVSPNTIAIIATAGTSEFGSIDPVSDIAKIAVENDIYLHVDAATGGLIIPFAKKLGYQLPDFDFSIRGVASITVDPHKYGLIPIPSGGLLFRDITLQEKIRSKSFFTGTPDHSTFIGTRPGASVLATYAVFTYLGENGFLKITEENFTKTHYLVNQLTQLGFSLYIEPELNIVTVKVKKASRLLALFEEAGWILSASKRSDDILRIVITQHVTNPMIDDFLDLLVKLQAIL